MQCGIIAPIKFLDKYCSLSKFQFCYGTLVLENEIYRNFYKMRKTAGDVIVMDYSSILPRKLDLIRPDNFLEAAKLVKPTVIILPSVDFQPSKTVFLAKEFREYYYPDSRTRCVGVIQGTTLEQISSCYKAIRKFCDIIGLPSTNELVAKRKWIIKKLKILEPTIYIEVHSNPTEEVPVANNVIGICTSYPLRLAYETRPLSDFSPTPSPLDFYSDRDPKLGLINVEDYLEVLEG